MAKGKGRKPANQNPSRKRKSTKRRPRKSTKSSGIGTVIHKGIRSVLALLPGSGITQKFTDIIFNSLGWSDRFDVTSTGAIDADVRFTGLTTAFHITAASVMGDCVNASTSVNATQLNDELRTISTNFQLSRVSHFKVTATNAGPATTHGQWIMAFWPYQSAQLTKMVPYSINECRAAPYYVEGASNKALTLKHYFPISNLYARQFGDHTRALGVIAIVYTETNRTAFDQLTSTDFDPSIEISGSVIMTARSPAVGVAISNEISCPVTPQLVIRTSVGVKKIDLTQVTSLPGKGYATIKGKLWTPPSTSLSLEEMAID